MAAAVSEALSLYKGNQLRTVSEPLRARAPTFRFNIKRSNQSITQRLIAVPYKRLLCASVFMRRSHSRRCHGFKLRSSTTCSHIKLPSRAPIFSSKP